MKQTVLDKVAAGISGKLIKQFGASVRYTRQLPGDYDTTTSKATAIERSFDIKALVADYNLVDSGAGFASGMSVHGDKEFTIAATALPFVPAAGDILEFNEERFTAVLVKTDYSGEQRAVYSIQARQ